MIVWDKLDERYYSHGVDRGILGLETGIVPWNGITGVTEAGAGAATVLYRDGQIFYTDVEPGDYSGSLTTYSWPLEFDRCIGIPEIAPGLKIGYQRPRHFNMSYRSLVGSGAVGDMFGYQIHLFYNVIASPQSRSRKTKTDRVEIDEFTFDLVATPVTVPGYRPSSHFIVDTRFLEPASVTMLESMLYDSDEFPSPLYIYELLKFGEAIQIVLQPDGSAKISGAASNVSYSPDGHVLINDQFATATDHGTYVISDS